MKTNLISSKALVSFTLTGMTDATGETVLFICILSAKSLSYCAYIPYGSSKTMEENMGEVKSLPGLLVFKFRGEYIPGLICMSPKVSISSDILTKALNYLDKFNIFERRQDGPTPFGLLDVHGSILQLLSL